MRKLPLKIIILFAAFLSLVGRGAADDNQKLLAESKYFTIYANKNVDISGILAVLNFDYFLQFESLFDSPTRGDLKGLLGKNLDAIYLEVSNILDVKMFDFNVTIKIFSNQEELNQEFRRIFNVDYNERAFYYHEFNTLYISAADATLGMIGHEIAHAVISHYFIVPPPPKIQEVLSGYVEFSLRKLTSRLSSVKQPEVIYKH